MTPRFVPALSATWQGVGFPKQTEAMSDASSFRMAFSADFLDEQQRPMLREGQVWRRGRDSNPRYPFE